MQQLKTLSNVFFGDLEGTSFFTLSFHMLEHIVEDVPRFEPLDGLDSFSFVHLNYAIKKFIRRTFMRRGSTLDDAEKKINS